MQVTLDLSSSGREEERQSHDEHSLEVDLSCAHCKRTGLLASELKCTDQNTAKGVDTERSSCGLIDEPRGSELCSTLQSHALYLKRWTDGFKCGRLKSEQNDRHKLCKDTFLTSSSSHDISPLPVDVQPIATSKIQGYYNHILQYSSEHMETDRATQCNSKFQCISRKKKPPVYTPFYKNKTSFYSISNFLFACFLLISLFSPSLSLSTSSASTSPNLKSWRLAALETIDTGTEQETSIHQVPIPDMTAIVGRLFQLQIPSSAFNGEVSSYKAIQAGSRELPKWIYFDDNAGLFSGVPLPEDKGQIYVSVEGHITSTSGKVSVQTTIFSLNVVQPNFSTNSSTLEHIVIAEDQAFNCNQSSTTRLDQCLPSKTRVLANILFLVPFHSLFPSEKVQLFINTAKLFDICLQHLELRSVNWTNDEGVWLWSKLATGEIIDSLESATILSFQIGCENFNYFTQSSLLELITRSTDICREGLLLSDEGYVWVNCHQWFITAGTKVFLSQANTLQAFDRTVRTKRQGFDGTDGPVDFPDFGNNDDDEEPSTTSSSVALSSTTSLESSVQTVASSVSEFTNTVVSLVPSSSAFQPQSVLNIRPTPTSSLYITLGPGSEFSSISSDILQPSSAVALPQESITPLPSLIDGISSTLIKGQPLVIISSIEPSMAVSTTSNPLALPQPSRSIPASPMIAFTSTEVTSGIIAMTTSILPTPTENIGSGIGSGADLPTILSSSMDDVTFIGPTSTGAVESLLMPIPEPTISSLTQGAVATPQPSSLPISSDVSMSSSLVFSSIEAIEPQTQVPFLTISSSLIDRPFIRVSSSPVQSSPVQSPLTPGAVATPQPSSLPISSDVSVSSSLVFSSIEAIEPQTQVPFLTISSSLIDRPFIRVSSSSVQSSSPLIRASSSPGLVNPDRSSRGIRTSSSIIDRLPMDERTAVMMVITPTPSTSRLSFSIASTIEVLSPSAISLSLESSIEISPTETFLFSMSSSDILRSLPLTTSPMIDFSVSSDIGDVMTTIVPTPVRTTNILMPLPTSELSLSMSAFTPSSFPPDVSSIFMPIFTSLFVPSSTAVLPVSPTATITSDGRLRPMSTSELTLSISIFTPNPTPNTIFTAITSQIPSFSPMPIPSRTPISDVSSTMSVGETVVSSFIFIVESSESLIIPFSSSVAQLPSSSLPFSTPFFTSTPFLSPSPTPDISLCDFINCTNGECVKLENDTITCECFPGWTGMFCEISIPVPSPSPSMLPGICDMVDCNNGTCIPDIFETNFTCQCFHGYTGEFCDVPIESLMFVPTPTPSPPIQICDIVDCNNGTCVADDFGDNFTCQCFAGFTGEFCDLSIPSTPLITSTPTVISKPISIPSSFLFVVSSSESLLVPFLTPTPSFSSSPFTFSISSSEFLLLPSSSPPPSSSIPSSVVSLSSSLPITATPSSSVIVSPTPIANISLCDFINCTNGECIELESDFVTCECFPGFTGMFCEIPLTSSSSILTISPSPSPPADICDSIDCNNGTCLADESGDNFTCQCSVGYTGEFCDILLPISTFIPTVTPSPRPPFDICDFIDCNNGTCIVDEFGEIVDFTCQCFAGFTGEFCDILLPSSTPISISPTPVVTSDLGIETTSSILFFVSRSEDFVIPFSTFTTSTIPVSSVFISPTPSPPISLCDFVNCTNGVCLDLGNDMIMCDCFAGFTGIFCDVAIESTSFMFMATPTPSPLIDICDIIDCNNGTCLTDGFGANFTCQCDAGYTGEVCDIVLPTSATSTSIIFSISSSEFMLLPSSFEPSVEITSSLLLTATSSSSILVSPTPTVNVTLCDFINCTNGECIELEGDFVTCECFSGFTGMFCEIPLASSSSILTISPSPSPPADICDSIDCNNGTCLADESGDNFTCQCNAGYTGEFCDVLLPTSTFIPTVTPSPRPPINICDFIDCNNGTCIVDELGEIVDFTCQCFAGFTGEFCDILLPSSTPVSISPTPVVTSDLGIETTSSILFFVSTLEDSLVPFSTFTTSTIPVSSVFISPTPSPPISLCDFVNCTNGVCLDLGNDTIMCDCFAGFTGIFCDVAIESTSFIFMVTPTPSPPIDICDNIDCNNGTCLTGGFGENFTCQCDAGYTGEVCDIVLPTSATSTSIIFSISSSEFMLLPSSFQPSVKITSSLPLTATSSSSILVSPTPIVNISLCDFINCTNGECIELEGDFVTCECFSGFTGMFCEIPLASSSPILTISPSPSPPADICDSIDCNNGTCLVDESGDNFTCQCNAGYTGELCDILLPTSTFIPTVTPSPRPPFDICDFIDCNNGTCIVDELGEIVDFICQCFAGFTGEFCDIPLVLSSSVPPVSISSPMQFLVPSSESLLVPFSSPAPSIISTSSVSPPITQTPPTTTPTTATATPTPSPNVSLCEFINCTNGECIDRGDDFVMCECFPGFTGMFCDVPIGIESSSIILSLMPTPSPSPPFTICDVVDCNNGTCVADVSGENFTCECFAGFTGEVCDIALPPPSICDQIDCNNGICVTDVSGENFTCKCFAGFTGEVCDIALPPPSICDQINCNNGTCVPDASGENFTCECFAGFTGEFCDIALPPPSICDQIDCNNGTCMTDVSGENFTCECFTRFTGEFCDIALPPPSICDLVDCNNGTCVADVSGENFTCECFGGFTGEFCDIALPPPSICDQIDCNNGTCVTNVSSENFTCECFAGFTGEFCDITLPPPSICDSVNCSGNGECIDLGDTFNCSCFPEFTGEQCDILIPPSPTQTSSTIEDPFTTSMFMFLVPSSESLLIPLPSPTTFVSFSSPLPTPSPSPPVNFCNFVNCSGNGNCNDLGDGYNCTCYVGWTGTLCETDIDFCQPDEFGSCNQTGTAMCIDGNSTEICECHPGFTGLLCSVDIDDCDPDPCLNNATCVDLSFGEFMCECPPGFTGELCEETFSPCDPNPCMEPEEVCVITGFGEDDFMCVPPPMTTTMIDISTSTVEVSPSVTSPVISTPSPSISTIGESITSSMFSATPTPTPIPRNSAPTVLNPIGTLLVNEGQVTHFIIPELTFYDAESGTTSNLRLSLLDSNANELPNTTWIHLSNGAIQALPLRDQAVLDFVTEYTFLLRVSDEQGASTHDFVTVRVLRQREKFQNFLIVTFEGLFTAFSQNLTDKVALTQRLSAHIYGNPSSVATVFSTPNIYVRAFRNGSIAVAYRDISIPDSHCADFRAWVATVYTDSSYTPNFIQILTPRFIPIAQPMIEGLCNNTYENPTLTATQGLSPIPQSNIILFLAIVIPTIFVACICLLIGLLLFITYRSRRSERKNLRSRAMERTFTHRRPVLLDEEWDLPNRRRRPVILPTDYTVANTQALAIADPANDGNRGRRPLLEEVDYGREGESSSDEEEIMTAPGLGLVRRNRHAMMSPDPPLDDGPPPYVLPPLFLNNN